MKPEWEQLCHTCVLKTRFAYLQKEICFKIQMEICFKIQKEICFIGWHICAQFMICRPFDIFNVIQIYFWARLMLELRAFEVDHILAVFATSYLIFPTNIEDNPERDICFKIQN